MDPKDLKNSDELKSTAPDDHKQLENAATDSANAENKEDSIVEEKETVVSKKKVSAKKPKEKVEEKGAEPTIEEAEKAPVEETTDKPVKKEEPKQKEDVEVKGEAVPVPKETDKPVSEKEKEEPAKDVSPEKQEEKKEPEEEVAEKVEVKGEVVPEPKETDKPVSEEEKEEPAKDISPEKQEEKKEPEEEVAEKVEAKEKDEESKESTTEEPKAAPVSTEETKKQDKEPPKEVDYTTYTQIELVNALRDLIDEAGDEDIKFQVENIKSNFYKLLNARMLEQKEAFINEGGKEEDFVAEKDPYEQDIKDLLKKYRQQRIDFNKKLEGQKEENLVLKYEVIEEIKNLINNEESINKTFQEFRELQMRWREIGLVPQSKMKDLWDTYHFHVENFYDYIKINKELRDLDLRKNLEIKIGLCEKAEELLAETSIIKAFNTLQKYHEEWREIGPVPRDKKEEIWERFKAATSLINKKHQEFFENRKKEQKKNLEAKTHLCEKAEEIANIEIKGHKEWDEKSKELIELQKVWRTIGFAPKRDNNRIYDRFRNACDKFFESKREFYAKNKELQQNNLQLKIDLCVQAEALKDSTDWKKTTQDFINIQKKWKEVGPVPRKHSDAVWKRFRAACDYFFDKKSDHFSSVDGEQVDNLKAKEKLIEDINNFKPSGDIDTDLVTLKSFQRKWTEIGHVPIRKKDDVQNRFREAINKHFDELNLDDSKRNMLKFRNKVSNFSETSRGQNKMRFERDKYMNKMKQLENDLVLLENNIGFFSQSKNAESLIADVNKKIAQTKEKIEFLKNKIRIIDEYDGNEE